MATIIAKANFGRPNSLYYRYCKWIFAFINIHYLVFCQPSSRHDPFDWIVYRKPGTIRSFAEGFSYIYIGTESAGIYRYSIYGDRFEAPITRAQGLASNEISAIHFDKRTGTLWAATDESLDYTYTREGNWSSNKLDNYNLLSGVKIEQLGSSENYLWALAGTLYLKLDRVSGIFLGSMPFPDEMEINWSSGPIRYAEGINDLLMEYSVMDGWLLNLDTFISPLGKTVRATTIYKGRTNALWVGTESGIIFQGDPYMKSFYPLTYGLANTDVQAMTYEFPSWVGGRAYPGDPGAVTLADPERGYFTWFEGEMSINVDQLEVFGNCSVANEVWFGGQNTIYVYNQKDDFWRTLDVARGLPVGRIKALEPDTHFVWVASAYEIKKINIKTKRSEASVLSSSLQNNFIHDIALINNKLWVSTEYMLFCYDINSETMLPFRYVGNVDAIIDRIEPMTKFFALDSYETTLYAGTNQGIIAYNDVNSSWELIAEPTIYNNDFVRELNVYKKQLFIITDRGLIRFHMKKQFRRQYNYPFIGNVNDLYVTRDRLWLATDNGLIQFSWKKDL
jgi:ligand-binding sensor domain-containing protein